MTLHTRYVLFLQNKILSAMIPFIHGWSSYVSWTPMDVRCGMATCSNGWLQHCQREKDCQHFLPVEGHICIVFCGLKEGDAVCTLQACQLQM